MLRRTLVLFCIAALAFAKTPRPLANVPIHTPDLKAIDLKKFRGKAIVVVIFSTTCHDCVALIHMMDGIQKEFGPQGLQVVGAAGDDNAKFLLGPFISRYKPSFPIGFLNKDEIVKLADVSKDSRPVAPIVLFIDRWGTVREEFEGNHPIFKDAERSMKTLSLAMLRVTPVGTAAPKPAAPPSAQR
jgi:thiol-disulfide isomerase/thioredoxin